MSRRSVSVSRKLRSVTNLMQTAVADCRICKLRPTSHLHPHRPLEHILLLRQCCRKTHQTLLPALNLRKSKYQWIYDLAQRNNAPKKNMTDSWKLKRKSPGARRLEMSTHLMISYVGRSERLLQGMRKNVLLRQPMDLSRTQRSPSLLKRRLS